MKTTAKTNTPRQSPLILSGTIAAICAVALLGGSSARAATVTWDIAPGTVGVGDGLITEGAGLWNTTIGNWTTDIGANNIAFTASDNVTFGGGSSGTAATISLGQNITVASLTFDTAFAGTYTIAPAGVESLTINTGGITANDSAAITANVILGGAQNWNAASGKTLTLSGAVTNGGFLLTVNGAGTVAASGTISGNGGLSKTGAGKLTLSGENTYSGGTTISTGGTLTVQRGAAMGTGAVTVSSGGALEIDGSFNIGNALTLNGTGVSNGGALRNISGVGKYNGNVTLGSASRMNSDGGILRVFGTINTAGNALTVGGAGDTSLWGVISAGGALTMDGSGFLNLGAANTYSGGTNINGGTVFLANSQALGTSGTISFGGGTLQYSGSNTADYSARFSTAAGQNIKINTSGQSITFATALTSSGGSLSVAGQGTLTLTKQNTYSGGTTVTNTATLLADLNAAAGDNVVSSSSALTLGGNLSVKGTGGTTVRTQTFNGTTFDRGNAAITPTLNAASTTANVLTVDLGVLTRNAGGTSNIVFTTGNTTTTNTQITTATGSANALLTDANGTAYLTFGTSATAIRDWAVKDSGNTKIVQAPASGFYTAATGTTILGNADIGAISPTITGAGVDNPVASIRFDNASARTLTLNDTSTFSIGGILITSNVGNNATIITGTGTLQGAGNGVGDFVIHNWDTSSSVRIDSVIGGSGGLTKAGTGTVILNAANTYDGPTTISGGILQVGNGGTTGDLGSTDGMIINNGTLTFNRNSASSALTVTNNISGSGGLTQQGAGTTILQGNLTYRGLTTVNAGVLTFDTGSARPFTSRGNSPTGHNRALDGDGLQINANGTVNLKGLFDAESTYITGGVLNVMPGGELVSRNGIGNGFFGLSIGGNENIGATYGMLNVTGGLVTAMNDVNATGQANPRFGVGIKGTSLGGLLRVSGGLVNTINLLADRSEITLLGGTIRTAGGAAPNLNTQEGNNNTGTTTSVLNVAGGVFDNGTVGLNLNGGTAGAAKVIINVNSGTLWTQALTQNTGRTGILNLNGGILKVGASSTTFTPLPISNTTSTFSTFLNAGGGTLDTNGFNITIQSNLMAPGGNGVTGLAVTTPGSGYNGAPIVTINDAGITQSGTTVLASNTIAMGDTTNVYVGQAVTGTGIPAGSIVTAVTPGVSITISQNASAAGSPTLTFKGQGATAYATYASGAITGYVVTNPGVGYVGTLSVALAGGVISGGTAATVATGDITTAANASGGLTKVGIGTLTLSGNTNTYTGTTTVSAGTLAFGSAGVATFASSITGPGTVSQTGTGTTVLNVANNYTGPTIITAGVLRLDNTASLPGGIDPTGGTSALIFNGGVLGLGSGDFTRNLGTATDVTAANFTGVGGWAAYGADRVVNIGGAAGTITWATANTGLNGQTLILGATSATHTVDLQNPLNLTTGGRTITVNDGAAVIDAKLSGIISGVGGGTLTKNGAGTLEISGDNTFSAAMTVAAGKVIFSGNNTGSASSPAISAGAFAQFNTYNSISGGARSITNSGTIMFGPAFGEANIQAGIGRMANSSSGIVAVDNYASTDLNFLSADIPNAFVGAVTNQTYTGTLTPGTNGYRLGGGGGTLTMANTNALTGTNAVTINNTSNVILSALNDVSGTTTMNAGSTLTLGTGVAGQNGSVGGNIVNNGTSLIFNNADALAYAGVISGTGALLKNGEGQLTFSASQIYSGTTTVNAGTLVLAGGHNTLAINKTLVVNTGGTLALGSNNQYVGNLTGTGGIVTGTGGILTIQPTAAGTFAGSIQGSVNVARVGTTNILTLTADSTTTGSFSMIGGDQPATQGPVFGGVTIKDSGRLSGITALNISNGSLFIDNSGTANDNDRIADGAAVTLHGGRIIYTGRASTASTESFGAVTLSTGHATITATPGSSGSAQVTLDSLTRNSGATLRVDGTNLGTAGNNSRIIVTGGMVDNLALVNGVVPGVVAGGLGVNNVPLLTYDNLLGFKILSTYSAATTLATVTALENVNWGVTTTRVVKTGGQTVNSISGFTAGGGTITFDPTTGASDTLVLGAGMITSNANNILTIGATGLRGFLTSGLASGELFLIKTNEGGGGSAAGNIHSIITDNGGTRIKLILDSYYRTNLTNQDFNLTAANTYTGGTVVSGGNDVLLTATDSGATPIPAANTPADGLIINNSSVTMVTNAQQIAATNIVTLNGGSKLTLVGANNTLAGLIFNSNGGISAGGATPTVTGGTKMTITGDIYSTPSDPSVTPLISVALDLNGLDVHDITVGALPQGNFNSTLTPLNGLTISTVISNGGFTKKGAGVLNLSGTNTFAGQLTIEEGVLNVASVNNASTSGVLGNSASAVILGGSGGKTGTLEYTGGNTSSSKPFTMATGGTGAFQVDAAATTLTLSGFIDGDGGLTKTGAGTLALTTAKTHTGTTLVSAGTLALGNVNALQNSTLNTGTAGAQTVTFTVAGTYNLGGLSGADDLTATGKSLSVGANGETTTFTGNGVATAFTKVGSGTLSLNGASQNYGTLTTSDGSTNVNGTLGTGTTNVVANANLKFGSVSQTLGSLTIGAGATVTFTSGLASLSGGDGGGKTASFGGATGSAVVPEPGSLGLLLVGALGLLHRRRPGQ